MNQEEISKRVQHQHTQSSKANMEDELGAPGLLHEDGGDGVTVVVRTSKKQNNARSRRLHFGIGMSFSRENLTTGTDVHIQHGDGICVAGLQTTASIQDILYHIKVSDETVRIILDWDFPFNQEAI